MCPSIFLQDSAEKRQSGTKHCMSSSGCSQTDLPRKAPSSVQKLKLKKSHESARCSPSFEKAVAV